MQHRKFNYSDDFEGYTQDDFEALEKWINDHIVSVPRVAFRGRSQWLKRLDNFIAGEDIMTFAMLDLNYAYDPMIIRLAMSEIDPVPVHIEGSNDFYYRAMWKDLSSESNMWRVGKCPLKK